MSEMFSCSAIFLIWFSRSLLPISEKPDEMMIAFCICFCPSCRRIRGTVFAGVAIIARSILWGTWWMSG